MPDCIGSKLSLDKKLLVSSFLRKHLHPVLPLANNHYIYFFTLFIHPHLFRIGYLNVYADDEDEEILEKRRSVVIDEDMFEIERESIPTPDSDDQILKSPQSGVF